MGQAFPPQRQGPGRQVLAPEARQVGASALSAWLGRARPASTALSAPERPSQRARRLEPRRLARLAPSPDHDVVPASWRARVIPTGDAGAMASGALGGRFVRGGCRTGSPIENRVA